MNQLQEFQEFMKLTKFRKNQKFNAQPQNKQKIIQYIENFLTLDNDTFLIIEELIKQYGISILLCFETFYDKINKQLYQQAKQYHQKFQRIASLVKHITKPNKFEQLKFFQIFGLSTKGFKVKQKTYQEILFIQKLIQIRQMQQKFKVYYKINSQNQFSKQWIFLQKMKEINQKNPFSQYYLDKVINKSIKLFNESCPIKKIQQKTKKQYNLLSSNCVSSCLDSQNSKSKNQSTRQTINQYSKQNSFSYHSTQNNGSIQSFQQSIQTPIIPSTGNQSYNTKKKELKYINFSQVPICCRAFFFQNQHIFQPQSERIQYKCYRYPYNNQKMCIIRKTITSFLNRQGGIIFIGIKEDVKTKSKKVLGQQYTEDDKQFILKTIRKITQKIYPSILLSDLSDPYVKTQFVPIRIGYSNQYSGPYDFLEKGYNSNHFQYKKGYNIIKITIKPGKRDQLYFYSQSTYNYDGQECTDDYFAFRMTNQVLKRQISQQILAIYRERLRGTLADAKPMHDYECSKPESGFPIYHKQKKDYLLKQHQLKTIKIEKNQIQNNIQFQKIRGNRCHRQDKSKSRSRSSPSKNHHHHKKSKSKKHKRKHSGHHSGHKKQRNKEQISNSNIPAIYDFQNVIKQTLYYIVVNMNEQKIVHTINKTPAKDFTNLTTTRDQLTGKPMYILKVVSYNYLQKFIKITKKIEQHFYKSNVKFIGISKKIKIQNKSMKNQATEILKKDTVLFIENDKEIYFTKIETAGSYCMKFKNMNINFEALPE